VTLVAQGIPKIGLVMEEVKLVRWLKNVGDSVVAGASAITTLARCAPPVPTP